MDSYVLYVERKNMITKKLIIELDQNNDITITVIDAKGQREVKI